MTAPALAALLGDAHTAAQAFEAALAQVAEVLASTFRRCAWCEDLRPFPQDFQRCGSGRFRPECKTCSNAAAAARREGTRDADLRRARARKRRAALAGAAIDGHTAEELAESWAERGLYACVYCGDSPEHVDHFVPLTLGGSHSIGNLVPACSGCNLRKGGRDPWTFLEEEGLLDGYRRRFQWEDTAPEPPPLADPGPF